MLKKIFFGEGGEEGISGSIIFSQYSLFAIPVPSKDSGLIYITCPKAINDLLLHLNNTRFNDLRKYLDTLIQKLSKLSDTEILVYPLETGEPIELFGSEITLKAVSSEALKPLFALIQSIIPNLFEGKIRIGIVSDTMMTLIIRKSLIVRPGIKLKGMNNDVYQKTVQTGPWFEEEIPKFSMFVGSILLKRTKIPSKYFGLLSNALKDLLGQFKIKLQDKFVELSSETCLLYTSPSPRDLSTSRMPSSA